MHADLAILRATAAMQKGGEIDEIALSIYYAPSSAHPVCFFKYCKYYSCAPNRGVVQIRVLEGKYHEVQ